MENIPREIVNIIIGYFRGYENKDKKILGLGEKEEYICNIMNHKLMEITKYEDKIWDEIIDKEKERILINTDKLLKGETIHKEEIKYKYNLKYKREEVYILKEIFQYIEEINRKMNELNHIEIYDMVKLCKNFLMIIKSKSNIHCLLIESQIYEKLIMLYKSMTSKIYRENINYLKLDLYQFEKMLQYYKEIYINIKYNYIRFVYDKEKSRVVTEQIAYLYYMTDKKYGYTVLDHIDTLIKIIMYYKNNYNNYNDKTIKNMDWILTGLEYLYENELQKYSKLLGGKINFNSIPCFKKDIVLTEISSYINIPQIFYEYDEDYFNLYEDLFDGILDYEGGEYFENYCINSIYNKNK